MTTQRDLRARLGDLMPADRRVLARAITRAGRIRSDSQRGKAMRALAAELAAASDRLERRRQAIPSQVTYPDLPIAEWRADLLAAIGGHQVVIVAGETGSGKSTQLPKMCLELGRGALGMIGHTQPRRIAARSIAERVAEELHTEVGGLVGYQVRFTDRVGDETLVKVMTDGILLNEIHDDRLLLRYDTLIIDEAHERSLNVDFVLGYLSRLLPRRPDLKLIITSATIDTERFASHFGGAPIVEVSGRSYPVEVRYRPLDDPASGTSRDQAEGIAEAVLELFTESDGDILVFCSGEREIRDATEVVVDLDLPHTTVLPLFGRLSAAEQHRVFESHTGRRVVIATNVAETSLTVPGIRAVVDTGLARVSRFGRRTKVQRLPIEAISRASADQRAGRCGRLGPGVCLRLYTEDDYLQRDEFTEPEILRTNLATVMLQMAALDLGDIESFPFLDPPDRRAIRAGTDLLAELGAVRPGREGTKSWLTDLGRRLARLPVDLRLGRALLAAAESGCLSEVLVITSALAIQDPRERPLGAEAAADQRHARFRDADSDLLSWLHLWEYLRAEQRARTSSQFRRMCRDDHLNYRRVREWQDVHGQLRQAVLQLGLHRNRAPAEPDTIHRAMLAGLLSHVGRKDPDSHEYRGARGSRFAINPGSTLFRRNPEWVMAAELVETSRTWARELAQVNPEWAEVAGAHLVKRSNSDPWWDSNQGSAVSYETVTLYGIQLASDRVVRHGRVDPAVAREMFITHALVRGAWSATWDFVSANRERFSDVGALEARHRRTDFLRPEGEITAWFEDRLPVEVVGAAEFNRWWKRERHERPHLLHLTDEALLDPGAGPDDEAFPESWHHGDLEMPLGYELDPTSETDGFIVDVPLEGLERVDPTVFDWLVPGLREELVTTLLRSLPKPLRRQLVPIPDTVHALLPRLDPQAGAVSPVLRRSLRELAGVDVPIDAFDLSGLPPHLRPYFRVVDAEGTVMGRGSDLDDLRDRLRDVARATVAAGDHSLERAGLTSWSFGELPSSVMLEGRIGAVEAFPTLGDDGDSVSIRIVADRQEQAVGLWDGTRRLLRLAVDPPDRMLRSLVPRERMAAFLAGPYDSLETWSDDCIEAALDRVIEAAGGPPADATGFDRVVTRAADTLFEVAQEVGRESLALFDALARLNGRLDDMPAGVFAEARLDIRRQVARLVFPGFIARFSRRLPDLGRYVAAMEARLERLAEDPGRDARSMAVVHDLAAELERVAELYPRATGVAEVEWMLQELRVSLFAQFLGTRGKVSETRVRRAIRALAG